METLVAFIGIASVLVMIVGAVAVVKGNILTLGIKSRKAGLVVIVAGFILFISMMSIDVNEAPETKADGKPQGTAQEQSESAEQYLAAALAAVGEWKIDEAKEALNAAMNLDSDHLQNDKFNEARSKISEAESVIEEIGPKPENSEWDGAVKPVVDYLNANLRDPGSCEYIEWSPVFLQDLSGEKYWAVRVKYRAKNAFGGYVIEEKIAWIRNDEVALMTDY